MASPFVEVSRGGKSTQVPGDLLAKQASDVLVRAAQGDPQVRIKLLEILLEQSEVANGKPLLPSQLVTLARVAATNPSDVPEVVRNKLFGALHDSDTRTDAIRSLLIISDSLDENELKKLVDNLELRDIEQLSLSAHRLSPNKGAEICRLLLAKAFDSRSNEDTRILAVRALGALGPMHADPTIITALRILGDKEAQKELTVELKVTDGQGEPTAVDRLAYQAALSLLQIAEGTSQTDIRTAAFTAFAGGDWGPVLQNGLKQDSALQLRLKELMRENPESIAIQIGVPQLLNGDYTAGGEDYFKKIGPTRIAAAFRNLGVELPDDAQLKLTKLALSKHSPKEIEDLLARLAAFNSLPPDIRRKLSASDATIELGKSLQLEGKTISAETFNRLPAEIRMRISGSTTDLPDKATISGDVLKGKAIPAELFNALSPELRKELSGASDKLPVAERIELSGLMISGSVFNKLPEAVRIQLFGSADLLPDSAVVPDLSRVVLSGKLINQLTAEQKQLLGLPGVNLPEAMLIPLQGRTITAATFNGLPDSVKLSILGSTDALPPDRVIQDLTEVSLDAATFNALPPDLRRMLRESGKPISPLDVLNQLASGDTGAGTLYLKLLKELPVPEVLLSDQIKEADDKAYKEERNLLALLRMRDKAQELLKKDAKEGVGWFTKLGDFLDLTEGQNDFIKRQAGQIVDLVSLDKAIKDQEQVLQLARARVQLLGISEANFKFAKAKLNSNNVQTTDALALEALGKYGWPAVKHFAPDIAKELSKQGSGINASPLKRLRDRGLTQLDHVLQLEDSSAVDGAQKGLELLQSLKPRIGDGKGPGAMFSDAAAIRRAAFDSIDQDDRIRRLFALSKTVHEQLSTLQKQIAIMQQDDGDRFEAFINDAKRRGKIIADALGEFTQEDGTRLLQIRDAWKKALDDGSITDPIAREELRKRVESLDTVLQLMAPNYSWDSKFMLKQNELEKEIEWLERNKTTIDVPEADYKRIDKQIKENHDFSVVRHHYWKERYDKAKSELTKLNGQIYQRRNLDELLKYLGGNRLSADGTPEANERKDFMRWLKRDGVELAITIGVAVVATSAVILTFGAATPLVVLAAAGAAGMMIGAGIAKESQRAMGIRSDGSLIGDYQRDTIIRDQYGKPQNMDFFEHVALPYLKEFGEIMVINILGGGLGNLIGAPLSRLTGAARSIFIKENAEVLARMTTNAARINAQAAVDPWYAGILRAAGVVGRETLNQTRFAATAPVFEKSFKHAAEELGLNMKGGDALLSFLSVVATSAVFRGMRPTVKPKSPGLELPNKSNLTFEYKASPEVVDRYIKEAQARKSTIEVTRDGFIETTKDGLKVEWLRAEEAPPTGVKPLEVKVKTFDALNDGTGQPKAESKVEQPNAAEAAKIQVSLDAMMEPFNSKMRELEKLTKKGQEIDAEFDRQIRECDDTAAGFEKARRLRMDKFEVEAEFYEQKVKLRQETAKLKQTIEQSDLYRQLQLAKALAEGVFPPGEYMYKVPGLRTTSVKLSIGELKGQKGEPVKVEQVNEILTAIDRAGIKPDQVTIFNIAGTKAAGQLSVNEKFTDIRVNTAGGQTLRLLYNHETGHLIDWTVLRTTFPEETFVKIFDAYKKGFDTGLPGTVFAHYLGVQNTPQFQKAFRAEMLQPANFDVKVTDAKDLAQTYKYAICRSELIAEMYKLHVEELRIIKETGVKPTYKDLLNQYTQGRRADLMMGFGELYTYLSTDVFPKAVETPKPKPDSKP
ncbi:MAG: DUF4200 domain-containing protein [Cyanobacteria bacterium]|nr:DUF4200 domain-containing protein [Cyanobacteriota bacterium]